MPHRPNILMIVGEDTGRWLGCYGDPVAQTPHLDRLASQGCRFDQAYATYPVCAPSRSTIVTGQYPMKIGTHGMRSMLIHPPRLFTHELRDAGYFVDWHSKLDFNFEPTEGWRDTDADWLPAMRAGEMPGDRPWFAFTNIGITHESGMWVGQPGAFIKSPADRPAVVTDPASVPAPPYLPDTPVVRGDIARHYDNIAELDRQIGDILAALDASGQAERTIVLFLADHGRGLPREKRWAYPAGIHMPLLVRWPHHIEAGGVDDQLVSWVDLAPTLLSLAGVPIPGDYDGQVFLGPGAAKPREFIFAGRDRMDAAFDRVRVARSRRWHYVVNFFPAIPYNNYNEYQDRLSTMQELYRLHAAGRLEGTAGLLMSYPKPEQELYDVEADPHCVRNLADDPAHAGVVAEHRDALERWLADIHDLGAVDERELAERGLIEDWFDDHYVNRIVHPPAERRVGVKHTVIEPAALDEALL